MKRIILLLTVTGTISLTANPFTQVGANVVSSQTQTSQKYFYAQRAAAQGNAQAQYDLGLMYATGEGVQQNRALALVWFKRAAENQSLQTKSVSPMPPRTATPQKVIFAQRAAAKGNPRAMFDLAMMYRNGDGVRKNESLAFNLFHKAARKGNVDAKFQMGVSFADGRGVRKQTQLARYWFKLAAKAGHRTAMAHLAAIEQQLRPHYGQNRRVAFNTYGYAHATNYSF